MCCHNNGCWCKYGDKWRRWWWYCICYYCVDYCPSCCHNNSMLYYKGRHCFKRNKQIYFDKWIRFLKKDFWRKNRVIFKKLQEKTICILFVCLFVFELKGFTRILILMVNEIKLLFKNNWWHFQISTYTGFVSVLSKCEKLGGVLCSHNVYYFDLPWFI